MDIFIKQISYLNFAFQYKNAFPQEASNAVLRMGARAEAIFVGFLEQKPMALGSLKRHEDEWEFICLYVAEDERRKGYGEAMAKHSIAHCKAQKGHFLLRAIEGHEEEEFYISLAKKLGFFERSRCTVYKGKPQTSKVYLYWENFMKTRGNQIIAHCEKRGIRLCSFEDAPMELISALKGELGKSFLGEMNPFHASYAPRWSFIAHIDGQPVAFSTANRYGGKLILEILQANSKITGAFAMPLFHFINKAIGENIETAVFLVYHHNQQMRSLTQNLIAPMLDPPRVQIDYCM